MQSSTYTYFALLILAFSVSCGVRKSTAPAPTVEAVVPTTDTVAKAEKPVWAATQGPYNPERTRKHDLLHTKLEVSFDWAKKHLLGVATLTLKPYFYPQQTLELDAKGFDIHGIKLVKGKKSKPLKYTYDNLLLSIQLDTVYTRNQTYTLEIDYTAKPDEMPTGGSEAIKSDKGLYFINADGSDPKKPRQIWTQGETQANSRWFPTIDSPNERCTQEMHITVDSKYVTLSNGTLIYSTQNADNTRTDVWEQKLPHAPYLFMMAVGDFAIVKDKWRNIPVNYYVEPAYKPYAKNIFGHTPEMMEFFSKKLGIDYPWAKYSQVVVRDFVSGAMENTSAAVFMEAVQSDDRQLLDQNWENIIAHELFHHWFGDLVTMESWSNLPLNESFANYSEYLWQEYKHGLDEADYHALDEKRQYFTEAENKQEPLIRYRYKDKEDMFDSHSYAKGGRILHMLRKYVGDDAFFSALKLYLNKHKFSDVEVHDLRLAFEETTGEDLNWFFDQWFLAAGHPDLLVKHTYENGKLRLTVRQQQDSVYTPIYKLPLSVAIWVNGKKTVHAITIEGREKVFEFTAAQKPDLVLFDAELQLLALVNHALTADELVFQYYNTDRMQPRLDAVKGLKENQTPAMKKMVTDALRDKFWGIRKTAIEQIAQHDTLLLDKLLPQIEEIANKDPKSDVRAVAMAVLATRNPDTYQNTFEKGLDDRSYSVNAAALSGYVRSNPAKAQSVIKRFESSTNTDIIMVLSDYYAQAGDTTNFAWFVKQIAEAGLEAKYFTIQNFGAYLIHAPQSQKQKGVLLLNVIARNDQSSYLRFAAYQSIALLSDLEGVAQLKKEIKENETNQNLKTLYNMMEDSRYNVKP